MSDCRAARPHNPYCSDRTGTGSLRGDGPRCRAAEAEVLGVWAAIVRSDCGGSAGRAAAQGDLETLRAGGQKGRGTATASVSHCRRDVGRDSVRIMTFLIALGGSQEAESAPPTAVELVKQNAGAKIALVRAVAPTTLGGVDAKEAGLAAINGAAESRRRGRGAPGGGRSAGREICLVRRRRRGDSRGRAGGESRFYRDGGLRPRRRRCPGIPPSPPRALTLATAPNSGQRPS